MQVVFHGGRTISVGGYERARNDARMHVLYVRMIYLYVVRFTYVLYSSMPHRPHMHAQTIAGTPRTDYCRAQANLPGGLSRVDFGLARSV